MCIQGCVYNSFVRTFIEWFNYRRHKYFRVHLPPKKCRIIEKGSFHPKTGLYLCSFVFLSYRFWLFTEMGIYFRKDFAKCMCYECYYEMNVLKWNHLKIYQEKGLTIENTDYSCFSICGHRNISQTVQVSL